MLVLGAARAVGIALILVPVPIAIVLLVAAARSTRVNGFLVTSLALTLVPAIWVSALRLDWGACQPCPHDYQSGAMAFVIPSVPLLVGAAVLLFRGQYEVPAALIVGAQILLAVGLSEVNPAGFVLMVAFVVIELLYLLLSEISRRSVASTSAGNGRPRRSLELSREG